jgi:hypothetical protein
VFEFAMYLYVFLKYLMFHAVLSPVLLEKHSFSWKSVLSHLIALIPLLIAAVVWEWSPRLCDEKMLKCCDEEKNGSKQVRCHFHDYFSLPPNPFFSEEMKCL